MPSLDIQPVPLGYCGCFQAMGGPCEVLVNTQDRMLAQGIIELAQTEALRVEHKFSRYRNDNIIHVINRAEGGRIELDEETSRLMDYVSQCYDLSDGLFDVTSGVLRQVWVFDGGGEIPSRKKVKSLLAYIGWNKVNWDAPYLSVPKNMEIDLGGLGKEYAVDRSAQLIQNTHANVPVLLNFGGDLFATAPPNGQACWQVGVEAVGGSHSAVISLKQGALTTSGDARRFVLHDGVRYPHVLNPRTGWPVMDAPRSVTVASGTCIEAGFLSTLAMLQGKEADAFLKAQHVQYWIQA